MCIYACIYMYKQGHIYTYTYIHIMCMFTYTYRFVDHAASAPAVNIFYNIYAHT